MQPGLSEVSSPGSSLLSICGPMIVVALLLTWSIFLALGAALIVHPQRGTSITNSSQETPTDFVTALYVAGSSLSIVGGSNFGPQSSGVKLLFLLNSVIGTSVISLTLTYLIQIYGAFRAGTHSASKFTRFPMRPAMLRLCWLICLQTIG
jgi:hypothetical protein